METQTRSTKISNSRAPQTLHLTGKMEPKERFYRHFLDEVAGKNSRSSIPPLLLTIQPQTSRTKSLSWNPCPMSAGTVKVPLTTSSPVSPSFRTASQTPLITRPLTTGASMER